ncbi:MAG: hypothetical protein J0M20_06460 [Burkholderiales bacterium]|nr:hypothetical protein [Burkholderiales bacterium]
MAIRLKSRWFREGQQRSASDRGGVAAVASWRLAIEMVRSLQKAGYGIEVGPGYFQVLREGAIFLALVADRLVHARQSPEERSEFTVAMVRHLAATYAESASEWLPPRPAGGPDWVDDFLQAWNAVAPTYADFGGDPVTGEPDLAFARHFAWRLEPLLPESDRVWVIDQVMTIEVPQAAQALRRTLGGVFDDPARRPRSGTAETGD